MTDLFAAVLTSCTLLVTVNVWAIVWRRMGWPTDPRRLVKFVAVGYRQMQPIDRINAALFVALVVGIVWGMG